MKNSEWLARARWGVMTHYLDGMATFGKESRTTPEMWNKRIDGFNVRRFADQLESVGAGYVIFTIGQNSGFFCSPNATYDLIVGREPSRCSRRDLIAEIARELAPRKIRLIAYMPSGAPAKDPFAIKKLEWVNQEPYMMKKATRRLKKFQMNWESILREWSLRWSSLVSGWWIDGCYISKVMYQHPEAPNFDSFIRALKAGNAKSIVAFNPGVKIPIVSLAENEDYTAGELSGALPLSTYAPDNDWYPIPLRTRVGNARLHALTYLGKWWGCGPSRLPDELVIGFTRLINSHGGAVTWDVPVDIKGAIPLPFLKQLKTLGTSLAKRTN